MRILPVNGISILADADHFHEEIACRVEDPKTASDGILYVLITVQFPLYLSR